MPNAERQPPVALLASGNELRSLNFVREMISAEELVRRS
jgi:hypothetical protein